MDGNNNMNTPPNNGANKRWNYDPVTGEPIFSNDVNLQETAAYPSNINRQGNPSNTDNTNILAAPTNQNTSNIQGSAPCPNSLSNQGAPISPINQNIQGAAPNPNNTNMQPPYPQAYQPTPEQIKQQQKIHDNSNNTALTLCIFSLCSWALGNVVLFGERVLTDIFGYYYTRYILPTSGFFLITGFVLAVIALIKYPKNTFAKILVAVYIIEVILLIILVIIAIVACVLVLRSCAMSCGDCLRIG